jgi:PAS domain S-box-containing protein
MKTNRIDFIDFERINLLLEGFNKATGFVTAILDLDGNILSQSGWRTICTDFHRVHPETSAICSESDTCLSGQLESGQKYNCYKCLNGLIDVAVPLIINGEHIANLFSGQFFFEKPSRDFFTKQAQKYNFNKKDYIEALDNVPVVSEEKVKTVMDFLLDMTLLISEITQQRIKQIEVNKILKESEEKYKGIFDSVADVIFIHDAIGQILSVNQLACLEYGYSYDEFMEMKVHQIDVSDHSVHADDRIAKLMNDGFIQFETIHQRKDKTKINIDVKSRKIVYNGQDAMISICRNITDKVKAEQDLIKAKEKAEEGHHLKSAFLANMSHEIRTPMNAILGFSDLLKKEDLSNEKREQFLDLINSIGKRLLTLISDIVDISKIDANQLSINLTVFNLNKLLKNLQSQFSIQLSNTEVTLTATCALADDKSFIKNDDVRLTQILSNLLENAQKFTKKGQIEFGYTVEGKLLQFFVKDTGKGIDKKNHESIFDRFRQANNEYDKSGSGTGLGLSIVKGIVELLGGEIRVESELNKGAAFYFSIPYIQDEPTIPCAKLDDKSNLDIVNKSTILIVEDEYLNFLYLEALFEEYQCDIIHAKNGQEAVEIANNNKSIDIILMDIKMPVMNGFQATEEIRKTNKSIPIIAQTAYAMAEDRQKAIDFGCNDYLAKPISEEMLSEIIKKHIKKGANRVDCR